ncbi:hypothetical protein BK140_08620 [Paenibacillus macerans]|nr:hypothetical protein BK140_08620 [Paenibacillus macerans]
MPPKFNKPFRAVPKAICFMRSCFRGGFYLHARIYKISGMVEGDAPVERGEEEGPGAKGHQSRYLRKNGGLQIVTDTDDVIYYKSVWMNGFRAK